MTNERTITIGGRVIGAGQPAYLIAEMSANHNHDFDHAVRIIEAAKVAGADAVKLQTYTADTITLDCDNEHFRIEGTIWHGRDLHELYREAYMPWEWQPRLKEVAERLGLQLFSSPFDHTAVDFLEAMDVPAYKVASFEVVDIPLLKRIAATEKPVVLSTGMATLGEIDEAVRSLRSGGCSDLALLKCTSAYPASPSDMNLRTIPHLADAFGVPVGLSDHTLGIAVPVAAVSVGAVIIEKHFTLSRDVVGPDSAFSLEPQEFRAMADAVRTAEVALGRVQYAAPGADAGSRRYRRSLFVVERMETGEVFAPSNVRSIRPALGLHPRHYQAVLGRRARRDIERGTPLTWDDID